MTQAGTVSPLPAFEFVVRRALSGDERFIVETTAKVRQPRGLAWRTWEQTARPEALRRLADGAAWVAEADGVLLGFILLEGDRVEMLFVKKDLRGLGIGLALLEHAPRPLRARWPTASWRMWCAKRRIDWKPGRA